jgi:hypothetical protein
MGMNSSIIALIISVLTFLGYVTQLYYQYFYKKRYMTLTVSNARIEVQKESYHIDIQVLYNNIGNQNTTITNIYIQLDMEEDENCFVHINRKHSKQWIDLFTLLGNEQKSLTLSYNLPIDKYDVNKISIRINTEYIATDKIKCFAFLKQKLAPNKQEKFAFLKENFTPNKIEKIEKEKTILYTDQNIIGQLGSNRNVACYIAVDHHQYKLSYDGQLLCSMSK